MRILSGIQPSGALHLGNYYGMMRPAIELQEQGEAFYFIADYHSMTSLFDAGERRRKVRHPQRFRLRAGFDLSGFSLDVQVILRALQRYGMMLADNGSAWFLSGAPHPAWNDDRLVSELRRVRGSDFEAVDVQSLLISLDSGQARQP
mgnify:CR=1 FL=1